MVIEEDVVHAVKYSLLSFSALFFDTDDLLIFIEGNSHSLSLLFIVSIASSPKESVIIVSALVMFVFMKRKIQKLKNLF